MSDKTMQKKDIIHNASYRWIGGEKEEEDLLTHVTIYIYIYIYIYRSYIYIYIYYCINQICFRPQNLQQEDDYVNNFPVIILLY